MSAKPLRDALDYATTNSERFRLTAETMRITYPASNPVAAAAAHALDVFASLFEVGAFDHVPNYVNDLRARLDLIHDTLATETEYAAEAAAFNLIRERPTLDPGTYRVIKRVVVGEDGRGKFVDEPGGIAVGGLWPSTLTRIERVTSAADGVPVGGH